MFQDSGLSQQVDDKEMMRRRMVSSGLTSWETQVHAARSDREKKKLGEPGSTTEEGRKKILCV